LDQREQKEQVVEENKKYNYTDLKKELIWLTVSFVLAISMLKIIFIKEQIIVIIKITASLFWMFLLPGYVLLLPWKDRLDFLSRSIMGFVLGAALFGLISYSFSILGLHVKYHGLLLPLLFVGIGIASTYGALEKKRRE